jgi:sulfopyruvate decarboxylase subunit alpha
MANTSVLAAPPPVDDAALGRAAVEFVDSLTNGGVDMFLGTPCGVLAPLFEVLNDHRLVAIAKEDNALAVAAGAACAGAYPCVLMQNSGFGQSINALTSLVDAYRIPVLMVISLRGTGADLTTENQGMGKLTRLTLQTLDIPLVDYRDADDLTRVARFVESQGGGGCHAILVHPEAFGWRP